MLNYVIPDADRATVLLLTLQTILVGQKFWYYIGYYLPLCSKRRGFRYA